MKIYLLLVLSVLLSAIFADSVKKTRVLVFVDSLVYLQSHSIFFEDLKTNGYDVTFLSWTAKSVKLLEFGEYKYDHIIILSSTLPTDQGVTIPKLTNFFDAGGNLFVATDIDASKFHRELLNEFGLQIDEIGSHVIDHFNIYDKMDHSTIFTSNQEADSRSFGAETRYPILYKGVGLSHSNYENFQVYGILKGENSTLSYHEKNQEAVNIGQKILLAAAVQGRNNARAVFTGSIDLLSNKFYTAKGYSNREYVSNLLLWNFQENGLLKIGKVIHHKAGETTAPFNYKIEDEITYQIEIFRWNHTSLEWVPYIAPHDIMLEFTMLDPYIRMPLTKKISSPIYEAVFRAPDKYGVFQFKVNYRRPGYTFISDATKVTVRPFKHDEYQRFLQQAYPYYASTFLTIAGLIVFIFYFLLDNDESRVKESQIKKDQ